MSISFNVLEHLKYKISDKTIFFWLQRLNIDIALTYYNIF